jgi:hypothetical protein
MPLSQEGKFFLDGSDIKNDGVSDISQGLLLGVSLADAARKHRAGYRPTPFFIMFQDNRVVHHLLPCSSYKYTARPRNSNQLSANVAQTHRAQTGQNGANGGKRESAVTYDGANG